MQKSPMEKKNSTNNIREIGYPYTIKRIYPKLIQNLTQNGSWHKYEMQTDEIFIKIWENFYDLWQRILRHDTKSTFQKANNDSLEFNKI